MQFTFNGHTYNTDDYNASTNPYGMGAGGARIVWDQFWGDVMSDIAVILQMTSTSSITIGSGSFTFTPAILRGVPVGVYMWAINSAGNWMYGQVTAVTDTTLTMSVSAGDTAGTGTFANWVLQPTGPQGAGPSNSPSYLADGGTISSSSAVASNTRYLFDDTSAGFTGTLPSAPSAKDVITFTKLGTNLVTLALNSLKFRGQTTFAPTIRTPGIYTLVYTGSSVGWTIDRNLAEYASQNANFNAIGNADFPVDCTGGNVAPTLPSPDGTNGTIRFRKFGTGSMILTGTINGSSGTQTVSGEGILDLYDSGSTRGWI